MTFKTLYNFDCQCYNSLMARPIKKLKDNSDIDEKGKKIIRSRVRRFNNVKFLGEDDLIQEASIAYLRARDRYPTKKRKCSFEAFVSIAIKWHLVKKYNEQENQIYGKSTKKVGETEENIFDVEDVERETQLDNDVKMAIDEIIKNDTTPIEKAMFDLYLDGYEEEDIANELEIPTKTVKYTITKVRKIIKENFPK